MKTHAEYRWYLWLRRELKAELGIPLRAGRRRVLTRSQEARVFREVIATRSRLRGLTYRRLARELRCGVSTLQAIALDYVIANGGTSLKTFNHKHVQGE
jgi:hypothetical protein